MAEFPGRTLGKLTTVPLSSQVHWMGSSCLECRVERAVKPRPGSQDSPLDRSAVSAVRAGKRSARTRCFSALNQLNT